MKTKLQKQFEKETEKEFVFIEPVLVKAGSTNLGLGKDLTPPPLDCRVVSEDTYQELKKAYDKVQAEKEDPDLEACKIKKVSLADPNAQFIPYQTCPKCLGEGYVHTFEWGGTLSTGTKNCRICNGAGIIPMYQVQPLYKIEMK